MRIRSYLH
ncbi:hypothetical protein GBAR_LOCUS10799 [Geodia barretti]|uniref:Uncharacterized protein n=1 Tax=Geodia barretti TaxID=519541 RepID=A0AA35RUE8_GEOBA|nr:hypothetical protein GBAR_LOCUS10799 [Geodia barretti]